MKITYIKMKNFANIYTSQKAKEIEIDFRESKNKIILLTGDNGSGKTSILSCLHPFATNGNLDVRSDNPLIRQKKEGYKEIHIQDKSNEYIIKHFYFPNKETHNVKSYIMKNGVELNENGNVTSFKESIKDELDIEMDYLKLSRLGSNVTNFIDLKTTDRKSFMGKILDEVEIYLKYFKKITNDMREVKSIISHTNEKLTKLNISNVDELSDFQDELVKQIKKYEEDILELNKKLSIIDYNLSTNESITDISDMIRKIDKKVSKIENKLQDNSNLSLDDISNELKVLNEKKIDNEKNTLILLEKKRNYIDKLDKLLSEVDDLVKEISNNSKDNEIDNIKEMISIKKSQIEERASKTRVTFYEPKFTKDELNNIIVMLNSLMEDIWNMYEFGQYPVRKALENIITNTSYGDYEKKVKKAIKKNKLNLYCEFIYNELFSKLKIKKDNCDCKGMELLNLIEDYATDVPDDVIEDDEMIAYIRVSYNVITSAINTINSHKDIIPKLPENIQSMLSIKNILNNMEQLKPIYDKEIIYTELSKVTEYELQQDDIKELFSLKERLNIVESSNSSLSYFKKKHKETIEMIDLIRVVELDNISRELDILSIESNDLDIKIENTTELFEDNLNYNENKNELQSLLKTFDEIKSLNENRDIIKRELSILVFRLDKIKNEYNNNEYRLSNYINLSKDLVDNMNTYDEMTLVKNALSSKEGIPLLYIEHYLQNIQQITNELLEIAYGDELYIENFNITADEFGIPYNTKGTSIKDVCYASQGEKSFITIALSFALIYESISKYNITLLDEIDSTLDISKREKFIQIIERKMEMIDAEQLFAISHNNMFSMYPVDIIHMNNKEDTSNKLGNYIKINYKGE